MKLLDRISPVDADDPAAILIANEIGATAVVQPSSEYFTSLGPFNWKTNIQHVVEQFGGFFCFGWALWQIPKNVIAARQHAIWETATGNHYDVSFGGIATAFAVDPSISEHTFQPEGITKFKQLREMPELDGLADAMKYDFPRVGTSAIDVKFETARKLNQLDDLIAESANEGSRIILP